MTHILMVDMSKNFVIFLFKFVCKGPSQITSDSIVSTVSQGNLVLRKHVNFVHDIFILTIGIKKQGILRRSTPNKWLKNNCSKMINL